MSEKIRLVRNDTRPRLTLTLTDPSTGAPIDLSANATVVRFKFREMGVVQPRAIIVADKLPGREMPDGTIDITPPYNTLGKGGRCVVVWTPTALAGDPGDYEGEIEITFDDGSIQTVYELLKFKLRDDFPNT